MMRQVVPREVVVGVIGVLGLLASLDVLVGLSGLAWGVGATSGAALGLLLSRGLTRGGRWAFGPADRVTLTRAVLACGIAALTADGPGRSTTLGLLVALSTVALTLDAVDGAVARRTGTASAFGARFDMEVDAFLILVLSVHVSGAVGAWVLTAGVARYVLLIATRWAPWLRRSVPARRWRKVVAALQGVVLVVAAAGLLGPAATSTMVAAALALLAASFTTQVTALWRLRLDAPASDARRSGRPLPVGVAPEHGQGVRCET